MKQRVQTSRSLHRKVGIMLGLKMVYAEEQIEMDADDWKASDNGYGCGGEGGGNGRFVFWLLAEIQPLEEMAGGSIMVEKC